MKKAAKPIFVILSALIVLAAPVQAFLPCVSAAETAACVRVVEDGVAFYRRADDSPDSIVFYLFKSYYLTVYDSAHPDFYRTRYGDGENGLPSIVGYVKKNQVMPIDSAPAQLYPQYTAVLASDSSLLPTPDGSSAPVFFFRGESFELLGTYPSGEQTLYYVYGEQEQCFGYFEQSRLELPELELHPIPLPVVVPPDPPPGDGDGQNGGGDNNGGKILDDKMQIILIVAILVPALVIVYMMFRPARKVQRDYSRYYD